MGLLLWVWLGLQQDSVSQYSSSSLQESQSHSERLHRHMSLFFGWACAVQSNFSSQKPATKRWIRKIFKIKALKWKHTPDTLQFVFPFTKGFLNCDQCKILLIQLINNIKIIRWQNSKFNQSDNSHVSTFDSPSHSLCPAIRPRT